MIRRFVNFHTLPNLTFCVISIISNNDTARVYFCRFSTKVQYPCACSEDIILWQYQLTSTDYITINTYPWRTSNCFRLRPTSSQIFIHFLVRIQKHIPLPHVVTKCVHPTILHINTISTFKLNYSFFKCLFRVLKTIFRSPRLTHLHLFKYQSQPGTNKNQSWFDKLTNSGNISSENFPTFLARFTTISARYL